MARKEPYWAAYLPSWREKKYEKPKIVLHSADRGCKNCTKTCDFAMYTELERSYLCPNY